MSNFLGQFHIKSSRAWHPCICQFFFIFAPFVDIIEIWKLWIFQLLTPSGSWVITIWKFEQNTLDPNPPFWIYAFFNNFWSKGPIKLKFGTGKFFGMRSPKNHAYNTKTNQCSVISRLKFLLCFTRKWDQKGMWHYNDSKKIFFFRN